MTLLMLHLPMMMYNTISEWTWYKNLVQKHDYMKWYQTFFETTCFKKGNEIIDVTLAEDDEQRDINEYPDVTLADVTIAHDDGQFKARHFHYFLTSI